MVLISLLLDLIAFGGYFLVTANPNPPIFLLLSIVESVIVVLLIGFTFAYRGQRHSRFFDASTGTRPYTVRFTIIVVSMLVNAAALFTYVMALLGNSIF